MRGRGWLLAAVVGLASSLLPVDPVRADEAVLRVIADRADVHTGPGFGFRVVHVAPRGEVLAAVSRATRDNWFQVRLADGTYGWVLGDEVIPYEVDTSAVQEPPGMGARLADAVFSPPPLADGSIGLTFSAGVLGGDGLFLFRPSLLLEPHVALEAFFGETVGDQLDVIHYGAGAVVFPWPRSPVTPLLAMGGGGAWGRKKADQFTIRAGHHQEVNVGAGLLVALKKRVTLRGDYRHYVLFDANHTTRTRELSGGLLVVF